MLFNNRPPNNFTSNCSLLKWLFSVCTETYYLFDHVPGQLEIQYYCRWKWEQQNDKLSLFPNKCLLFHNELQVIRSEMCCVILNQCLLPTGWVWLCCFPGGSQPRNGHGWVWLYEQCHEMSVQIWWPQSLHVWMSCRWGQKILLLFLSCLNFSPPPSLIVMFFFPLQEMHTVRRLKTCLSTRGKSPTTLCSPSQGPVRRPSDGARRLLRVGWGWWPSGP